MLFRFTTIRYDGSAPQFDLDNAVGTDDPAFSDLYGQMVDDPDVMMIVVLVQSTYGSFEYVDMG